MVTDTCSFISLMRIRLVEPDIVPAVGLLVVVGVGRLGVCLSAILGRDREDPFSYKLL